jgi:flavin-dependent dehydrogenase
VYDVIVVGARCAGSPTAMLLAQQGYQVLLVDRAAFPSEMPMSTHLIWPPGVLRLQRWGVLDGVRACCPPISAFDVDLGPFHLIGSPPPIDGVAESYSPRRMILDHLLVEAAVKAGAELRERFAVEAVVVEDGRVTGVRGGDVGGSLVTEEAAIVVGADGPSSVVARTVDAPEYDGLPTIQGTCWSYWSGVTLPTLEFYPREHRTSYGWTTANGLTLVGVNWPAEEFAQLGADVEVPYLEALAVVAPGLAARVRQGRREERWFRASTRNFFRRPYGPGWALVGDAGYTKDPFTAEGISDAFRDAERLAAAVDDGLSERRPMLDALADYEQQRNEAVRPFYDYTCQVAAMESPTPEMLQLFEALHGNQTQTARFLGVFAQTVSPKEFFAPENIERLLASAGGPER